MAQQMHSLVERKIQELCIPFLPLPLISSLHCKRRLTRTLKWLQSALSWQREKQVLTGQWQMAYNGSKARYSSRMHPLCGLNFDEDITCNMSTTTPAAPPHQAPLPSLAGPITRARARDLNFVMLLKNEGPEE
jgi:hypothetical protein